MHRNIFTFYVQAIGLIESRSWQVFWGSDVWSRSRVLPPLHEFVNFSKYWGNALKQATSVCLHLSFISSYHLTLRIENSLNTGRIRHAPSQRAVGLLLSLHDCVECDKSCRVSFHRNLQVPSIPSYLQNEMSIEHIRGFTTNSVLCAWVSHIHEVAD